MEPSDRRGPTAPGSAVQGDEGSGPSTLCGVASGATRRGFTSTASMVIASSICLGGLGGKPSGSWLCWLEMRSPWDKAVPPLGASSACPYQHHVLRRQERNGTSHD